MLELIKPVLNMKLSTFICVHKLLLDKNKSMLMTTLFTRI